MKPAIALLVAAEAIISKRRYYEKICGYPEEYGGDHELLLAIRQYLSAPGVKEIAEEIKNDSDSRDDPGTGLGDGR